MARKTKEESERTYHALLDAAATLFIRQGVASTTLGHIAAEAGMTRGAIYWHFDNKEAVIQALWERNAQTLHQAFHQVIEQIAPPDPAGSFRIAVKRLVQSVVIAPELGQIVRIVLHNVEFTEEQTELQRFLLAKKREFQSAMEAAFSALQQHDALQVDLAPELLAESLLCYIHGLIHSHLSPDQMRVNLERDGDVLLDLFLDALLVH